MSEQDACGIYLDFNPQDYRTAVALLSAYSYGEAPTCRELIAEGGRDLICAFVVMQFAALGLLAQATGESFESLLGTMGVVAAERARAGQ